MVGAMLVEREADEALHAGYEDAALGEEVLVVEGDIAVRTLGLPVAAALEAARGPGVRAAAAAGRRRSHRELLPLKHW